MFEYSAGFTPYWWAFVLLGVAVGTFGGLLGLGGGVILIPALVLLLGFSQKSAQGMSLAFVVPIAIVAAIRYRTSIGAEFDTAKLVLLVVGGLAGVLVGTALVTKVPDAILSRVFACVMIAFAVKMLFWPPDPAAGPDKRTEATFRQSNLQQDEPRPAGNSEGRRQ